MAEALHSGCGEDKNADDSSPDLNASVLECAVCLQPCVHPALLPCGHIFCFLCLKGVANQSKKCAMCRQEIPSDYLDKPQLVEQSSSVKESPALEDGYQWFYEGRNGWWQYDERTCRELEAAYKGGERTCELLIAGFLYVVDFDAMLQLRRTELTRRRRIKRDLATIPKKGVAGLRGVGGGGTTSDDVPPPRDKSPAAGDGTSTQTSPPPPHQPSPPPPHQPSPPLPHLPSPPQLSDDTTTASISRVMEQIRSLRVTHGTATSEDERFGEETVAERTATVGILTESDSEQL